MRPDGDLVARGAVDHVEQHARQALARLVPQGMHAVAMALQLVAVHPKRPISVHPAHAGRFQQVGNEADLRKARLDARQHRRFGLLHGSEAAQRLFDGLRRHDDDTVTVTDNEVACWRL